MQSLLFSPTHHAYKMHDTLRRGILNQALDFQKKVQSGCVCEREREDGMGRKGLHLSPPASSALGLQGVRGSASRAEYHRGDWEIKADCLELVWSGLASSFGSPSDPIMVPLPDLGFIEAEGRKGLGGGGVCWDVESSLKRKKNA